MTFLRPNTKATDLEGRTNGFREEDLGELLASYDRLAVDTERRLAAGETVSATWYDTLLKRLLSGERKRHFCGGGRDYLGVAADGSVALCYRFFEDEGQAMGSVQESTMSFLANM